MNFFKKKTPIQQNFSMSPMTFNFDVSPTKKARKRAYHSAKTIPYLSSWISSPINPNTDIKQGLNSLRARSREAVQNNSFIRKFLSEVKINVVGEVGPILQSRVFGPGTKADTKARDAIEQAWKEWGEFGSPDVTGTKTWLSMLNEFWQQILMDGEYIAIEVYNNENDFGFQLQVIDPMLLDITYSDKLTGGRYIKESIEYNAVGKPLAYHFLSGEDSEDNYIYHGKAYKKVIASRVYHVFLPDFVNQRRGVPAVACALLRLGMLDGYTEAELVAARIGASKFGVWTDGENGEEYTGDGTDDAGEYVTSGAPGEFIKAPHGAKLDLFDPKHPNSGYSQFTSDLLREVSSGLNASYAEISNNYSDANYSSLRQALLSQQGLWKVWQQWMIDFFTSRVYKSFVTLSHAQRLIKVNNAPLRHDIKGYLIHTWQPKRWPWVDPLKEMNANKVAIDNYISSPQSIIREKGGDPEDVLNEFSLWKEQLEARGLPVPIPATQNIVEVEPDDDETKPKKPK